MTRIERFNGLYDRFAGHIHAWFTLCYNRHLADDLTQQTFLNVWKFLLRDDFHMPANWKAWLFRTAINVKNDHLRNKYARPPISPYSDHLDADADPPDGDLVDSIAVDTAFKTLTLDKREILLLKNMGFTSRESGALLGISDSAARSRLQKARNQFRIALQENGVDIND